MFERRGREEEERWGRNWVGDDEEDGLRVREKIGVSALKAPRNQGVCLKGALK
jgi:hypothetical protein